MIEVKMHTTIYWEVPNGTSSAEYVRLLEQLNKDQVLKLVTDFGDSKFEVNE